MREAKKETAADKKRRHPGRFTVGEDTKSLFSSNLFGELSDIVVFDNKITPAAVGEFSAATEAAKPGDMSSLAVVVNTGTVISADDFVKSMGIPESEANLELRRQYLIYVTAPCPEGFSGGPMLNAQD